mmetsp:Transcript_10813/g.33147  ORF Transcript_10813/g.33147 Transcript_10813/m.33147 type:complete len:113 (+) Transcript_10813:809-1147(+)
MELSAEQEQDSSLLKFALKQSSLAPDDLRKRADKEEKRADVEREKAGMEWKSADVERRYLTEVCAHEFHRECRGLTPPRNCPQSVLAVCSAFAFCPLRGQTVPPLVTVTRVG